MIEICASGIYQIRNKVNNKCYVGSAVNVPNRWKQHKRELANGTHHNSKLTRAWNKYGEAAFEFLMLELIPDKWQLIAAEQRWIDSFNCVRAGYNIAPKAGSQLGFRHSAESRKRISAAQVGKHVSEEVRAAISAKLTGVPKTRDHAANAGAAHRGWLASALTRLKMSAASKSRVRQPFSPETLQRMSIAAKKRTMVKHTPEQRAARSAWMMGRKISPETIAKRKATRAANKAQSVQRA